MLSLSATFGAMVWVFQDGHLSRLARLHRRPARSTRPRPILMFCVAFGLSMDYEVFLLSRIKEEYDRSGDNERSVALGLERTGRIVTAAALLISVVFLAFATSAGQLHQAVRHRPDARRADGRLRHPRHARPAFMRLAGEANWWAPGWLRRIHERIGFSEDVDLDEERTAAGLDLEELEPEGAAAPV